MLFIYPMWDSETQRLGMKKCSPKGYALRVFAEGIGFLGLLSLIGAVAYMIYVLISGGFTIRHWLLLVPPFAVGILSEIVMFVSWRVVSNRDFEYDYDSGVASWIENGERVTYEWQVHDQ